MPGTTFMAAPPKINLRESIAESSDSGSVPTVDLEWEPFAAYINGFLRSIESYVEKAHQSVIDLTQDHSTAVKQMQMQKEEMHRKIQMAKEEEGRMLASLEGERKAEHELSSLINDLNLNLTRERERASALESELTSTRNHVFGQKALKERQTRELAANRQKDVDELRQLEEVMGWKIEGSESAANNLLMRFNLIDPDEPEKEFSMVVDVSKADYAITNCEPALPSMPELLAQLNLDRDLFGFVKRVRKAFAVLVNKPSKQSTFEGLAGPGMRTPARPRTISDTPAGNASAGKGFLARSLRKDADERPSDA